MKNFLFQPSKSGPWQNGAPTFGPMTWAEAVKMKEQSEHGGIIRSAERTEECQREADDGVDRLAENDAEDIFWSMKREMIHDPADRESPGNLPPSHRVD